MSTPRPLKKESSGEPSFIDVYTSIYAMREDLERIRKPLGLRENPARTCKDLYFSHPHFKNGI